MRNLNIRFGERKAGDSQRWRGAFEMKKNDNFTYWLSRKNTDEDRMLLLLI